MQMLLLPAEGVCDRRHPADVLWVKMKAVVMFNVRRRLQLRIRRFSQPQNRIRGVTASIRADGFLHIGAG